LSQPCVTLRVSLEYLLLRLRRLARNYCLILNNLKRLLPGAAGRHTRSQLSGKIFGDVGEIAPVTVGWVFVRHRRFALPLPSSR